MNSFYLTISSPDKTYFSENATKILLRGSEGELAVMSGHIPLITTVVPGKIRVQSADGSIKTGFAKSGIFCVSDTSAMLLSDTFSWIEE